MKLNRYLSINSALTISLLMSATISANAIEAINYSVDGSLSSNGKLRTALAAKPSGEDQSTKISDDTFISKYIVQFEVAFAILVIIFGLVASAMQEKNQDQKELDQAENDHKTLVKIQDQPKNQDLAEVIPILFKIATFYWPNARGKSQEAIDSEN